MVNHHNTTYEWTGHYTIAARQQSAAIFQVKNTDNDWAVALNLSSNGSLIVNNRRNATDVTVTNPDAAPRISMGRDSMCAFTMTG